MPNGRFLDLEKVRLKNTLFLIRRDGSVQNRLTKEFVPVKEFEGIDYLELGELFRFKNNIGNYVRVIDLVGFGFKPVNVSDNELINIECLPIDGDFDNLQLDNLVWKFPIGGLESVNYPTWFYIPGFTSYMVKWNDQGTLDLLSSKILDLKQWHRDKADYLATSLACDTGQRIGITFQRIVGLTFLDYPLNAKDLVVDHVDQVRRNNSLDNFKWIGLRANLIKGSLHLESGSVDEKIINLKCRIQCLDFQTNTIEIFNSVTDVIKNLGVRDWQIRQSLEAVNEGRQGIVNGRFIFRLEGQKFPLIDEKAIKHYLSYGGQPRPTLMKDLVSNTVTEYPSAAQLVKDTKLSKKVVTSRLKRNIQQIPDTQYLVKYKDSSDPWII